MGSISDWEGLQRLSKEKKSPIGYAPFADACISQGNKLETLQYIARIEDGHQKVEYLMKVGKYSDAATVAVKELKEPDMLPQIRHEAMKNHDKTSMATIEQMMAQFK